MSDHRTIDRRARTGRGIAVVVAVLCAAGAAVPSASAVTRRPTRVTATTRPSTNGMWASAPGVGQVGFTVSNGRARELFGSFPMVCRYSDGSTLDNTFLVTRSNKVSVPLASNGRGQASVEVATPGMKATLTITIDLPAGRTTVGVLSAPPGTGQRCTGASIFTVSRNGIPVAEPATPPDILINGADGSQIAYGWEGSRISNFRARVKLSCSGGGPDGEMLAIGREEFPDLSLDDAAQQRSQVVERNGHVLEVTVVVSSRSASVSVISAAGQDATCTGSVGGAV